MSTFVAIDVFEDEATLVIAEAGVGSAISILGVSRLAVSDFAVPDPVEPDADESPAEDEDADAITIPTSDQNGSGVPVRQRTLAAILGRDVDTTVATLPLGNVLFQQVRLPFDDQKKIEQVAPLQVQDCVPFDLDNFLVDNLVLGQGESGEYEILSSLVPTASIAETLTTLATLGADPKMLAPRASALTGIVRLDPETFSGSFALLALGRGWGSLAVFSDGRLRQLREFFPLIAPQGDVLGDELLKDIRCSLSEAEHSLGAPLEALHVVASPEHTDCLRDKLGVEVSQCDLSRYVEIPGIDPQVLHELSWAVGLFANETHRSADRLIDFRKGPFAYKPEWRNFLAALKDELFYIVLSVLCGVAWFASQLYVSHAQLDKIETVIRDGVVTAIGDESIPFRGEVDFLFNRINDIEGQLEKMGTLSSVSPLESLRELVEAATPTVGLELKTLSITGSSMTLEGSVASVPAVGTLSKLLEDRKDRFCEVKVDPGKRVGGRAGSSRVYFSAEIKFCT